MNLPMLSVLLYSYRVECSSIYICIALTHAAADICNSSIVIRWLWVLQGYDD